jgi:hypothetical protein
MNELEHDNFIKGATGLPTQLVTMAGKDYPVAYLEETKGDITYRGEVVNPSDLNQTGAAIWMLSKTTKKGNLTKVEYASQYYEHVWDYRHNSFAISESSDFSDAKAMVFDGISDYVAFPNRMFRDSTEKWSISFWYKPRSNNKQAIFSRINPHVDANKSGRQVSNSNGNLLIEIYTKSDSNYLIIESKTNVDTGLPMFVVDQWHHVVIAFAGGSSTSDYLVWCNGVDWTGQFTVINDSVSGTNMKSDSFATTVAYFGKSILEPTWMLDGVLDDVVLSDSRWTDSEAGWLWNYGVPNDVYYLTQTSYLDVRYWFRMGDGAGDSYPWCNAEICNDPAETPTYSLRGSMVNMSEDNYIPEVVV